MVDETDEFVMFYIYIKVSDFCMLLCIKLTFEVSANHMTHRFILQAY